MAKKNSGSKAGLGLAAIAAAGAAAAAGYYFYASKEAPKHRKIAAKWAGDLKREVVKEAKMLKNVDRAKVQAIVDKTTKRIVAGGTIDKAAVAHAARELKAHWDEVRAEAGKGVASAKKAVKKAVKTAKKSAKKSK